MYYHVGDIVEGVITGIQPYGAFVHLDDQHNGLIHISEISSGYVKEVANFVKLHQKVKVKVLDVEDEHLKLSLKAIQPKGKRSRRELHNYKLEEMTIGFSTLEQHLNEWIQQAMKEAMK
ncbi:MAG: CvfD/Ygs/GSP13 family RNA-binding post-transcriptional regulator [Erysipelotrichaceae bacterium]